MSDSMIAQIFDALGNETWLEGTNKRLASETLEYLSEADLAGVLKLSRSAAAADLGSQNNYYGGLGNTSRQDRLWFAHLLVHHNLREVSELMQEGVHVPEGMPVYQANRLITRLAFGGFKLDTHLLTAQLHTANELGKWGKGYTLNTMVLVQNHPDKAETIIALVGKTGSTTEAEVLLHHGFETAFHDGVL